MRAGDALRLGSTMLKPMRSVFDSGGGRGCALGMINRAVGGHREGNVIKQVYPWLDTFVGSPVEGGCRNSVYVMVMELFDNQGWSSKQIADWLDTIDPTPVEVDVPVEQPELVTV